MYLKTMGKLKGIGTANQAVTLPTFGLSLNYIVKDNCFVLS